MNDGYEDFSYGPGADVEDNRMTASKPESKLWYHDGFWWATLYNPAAGAHRIHYLNRVTETWVDTGVAVDERAKSRQDVLFTGSASSGATRTPTSSTSPSTPTAQRPRPGAWRSWRRAGRSPTITST